ncbi:hypothetical protein OHC33_000571 [Knufia fluminis]|uniref:TPR domain protein n=1 Tax=Knufia fluminis TaxID=191047 RepID=A0AAN8EMV2_9EURO|nr:hypothetical protein OHC33_000571 [Knufia fluminis]
MQLFGADVLGDDYYDLGTYHRRVTTPSEKAQTWFDRGLIWSYGYNHEAAAGCFEKAISYDGECPMAYWGLAYALGPNYNKPWEVYDKVDLEKTLRRTHQAAAKAKELAATNGSSLEKGLTEAIQYRYLKDSAVEDPKKWNKLYSDAMQAVYERHGDDLDVACLYADSMMNLTPWNMWDIRTGKPNPDAKTYETKSVLEKAFGQSGGLEHPGLLHLYIHLMEMSPTPEMALPIADRLRGLVPDAGHLEHMPTHIDVLCGDWRRAVASNTDAIRADEKYVAQAGAVNFYTIYRCHDYHFKLYGAMFAGQSKVALQTAKELAMAVPEGLLRVESPPMADWLEGFSGMGVHALIRFGKWQEIIDLQLPADQELYCYTTAIIIYAKGVALSAIGQVEKAEKARKDFRAAVKKVKPSRALFNNTAHDILAIADAMLDGELEYRKANYDVAFQHLRRAVHLDDSLPYDEPWGWLQPTRHAYGALLLEQNHVEKAAKVYAADLGLDNSLPRQMQHPNNVWALHGYHECLKRLGRHAEADIIEKQLKVALAAADVPIAASCYCRRGNV